MCAKKATFNADEVYHILVTLQEFNMSSATLYAIAIALLYFPLLRAGEVRMIQVKDMKVTDNTKM